MSAARSQDLLKRSALKRDVETCAPQLESTSGSLEGRLGMALSRMRHDDELLVEWLAGLPLVQRLAARVVAIRQLGSERGTGLCLRAFGPMSGPYAKAQAQGRAEVLAALSRLGTLLGISLVTPLLSMPLVRAAERRGAMIYRRRQEGNGGANPEHPVVQEALSRAGRGERLPEETRKEMEARFGVSFSRVQIHTDRVAAEAARAVQARAFTVGEDIFFAEGAFEPGGVAGRELLAHELTHVVQGWQGRVPAASGDGVRISEPGDALEREAEGLSERLAQPARLTVGPGAAPLVQPPAQRAAPVALARSVDEREEKEEESGKKEKKEEANQGGEAEQRAAPAAGAESGEGGGAEAAGGDGGGAAAAGGTHGAAGAAKADAAEAHDNQGEPHGADAAAGKGGEGHGAEAQDAPGPEAQGAEAAGNGGQAESHAESKGTETHETGAPGAEAHAGAHVAGGPAEAAHGGPPMAAPAQESNAKAEQPPRGKTPAQGADKAPEGLAAAPQASPPPFAAQPDSVAAGQAQEPAAHQEHPAAHLEQEQAAQEHGAERKKPEAKQPAAVHAQDIKKAKEKKAQPRSTEEKKAAESPAAQARPGGAGGKDAAAAPASEASSAASSQPKGPKDRKEAKEAEGASAKGQSGEGAGQDHAGHGRAGGHGAARGGGGGGGGGGGARKPEDDPDFQATKGRIAQGGAKAAAHPGAGAAAGAAQAAAVGPPGEVQSQAEARHLDKLQAQQPKEFSKEAFKAAVLAKIGEAAPRNPDEVKEFKNSGQLESIKSDVSGKVQEGKDQTAGDVKKKAAEAPSTAGIPPKPVTPLAPPPVGAPLASVGAANAMPKPRPEPEVSLKKDSDSLDKQMADAKVTEEQFQHSNEGQWQQAVGAKKEAQSDAQNKPGEYRQQEQSTLGGAKGKADTAAQTKLQAMHSQRQTQLQGVQGHQQTAKGKDEQERSKIAAKIESLFGATKGRVEERLKRLDGEVSKTFDEGAAQARKACLDHIDRKMDERYSGVGGWATWVADQFRDINELPEIKTAFAEAKQIYVQRMDQVIDGVAAAVEAGLTEAKAEVVKGKQEVAAYVQSLPAALRKVGQEAQKEIQGKFEVLAQSVKDKQNELVDTLAQKYQESEQQLQGELDKIKAENRGLINKAKEMIGEAIETILKLKDMLMGTLARAAGVIDKIIQDPIGFLGNLVAGAKAGFMQFGKNIAGHLKEGLVGWLTGALGGAGIQLPTSWDLKGIAQLVMSILGVTWQAIRSRAVKLIGEPAMAFLEKASEVIKVAVTGGPMALWEHLKESVGDIKTMVMDGIKNMVITQVIQAGITWVVSLFNPASAFIRACKMIVDVVMFFVERAAQIGELVNALLDSLEAVVGGNIGAMAAKIEAALGRAIPVVIGFLANLLGLGGIASKIKGIIEKIKAPIEKAIDWVIQKAVGLLKRAGKWLKGKFGQDGKDKKDGKDGKDDQDDKKSQAVKAKAGEKMKARHPFKSKQDLMTAAHSILGELRPEGLKQLNANVAKDGKSYRVIAVASPEVEVDKGALGDGDAHERFNKLGERIKELTTRTSNLDAKATELATRKRQRDLYQKKEFDSKSADVNNPEWEESWMRDWIEKFKKKNRKVFEDVKALPGKHAALKSLLDEPGIGDFLKELQDEVGTIEGEEAVVRMQLLGMGQRGTSHVPASKYGIPPKHVRGNTNDQRQENAMGKDGTGGAGQYFKDMKDPGITNMERRAFAEGQIKDRGDSYHVFHTFDQNVGYNGGTVSGGPFKARPGDPTKQIRAEWSSGSAHSHPRAFDPNDLSSEKD